MAKDKARPKRPRGQIETLPSGSLRVSVYAGTDPISKDRVYLRETVPAGPHAEDEAEKVLTRFLLEVYERRHPRTDATVEQLLASGGFDAGQRAMADSLGIFRVPSRTLEGMHCTRRRISLPPYLTWYESEPIDACRVVPAEHGCALILERLGVVVER